MEDKKMDEIINRIDTLTEKVEQIIVELNKPKVISLEGFKCDGDKLKDIIAQKDQDDLLNTLSNRKLLK